MQHAKQFNMDKRSFLKTLTMAGLATPLSSSALGKWMDTASGIPAETLAADESYWQGIRSHYLLKPDYINLENGYYNILPKDILDSYIQHIRDVNYQGSYYMRTVQ